MSMFPFAMRRYLRLAVLLPVIVSACMAQEVDPVKLVQAAIANAQRNTILGQSYAYQLSNDWTYYNKHWLAPRHEIKVFDAVSISGEPYLRLIQRNGKPLSGKAAQEEQKRWEQIIAGIHRRLTAVQERRSFYYIDLGSVRHSQVTQATREPVPFEDLPRLFDLKLIGTEPVHDRMAYVIEATPSPGTTPADKWEEAELNDRVTLWIDLIEQVPLRLHLEVLSDRGIVTKGTTSDLEWEQINKEVWFETRTVLRLPTSYSECHVVLSNFRKFTVESRVLPDLAPQNVAPAERLATAGVPPQDPVALVNSAIANLKRIYHERPQSYAFEKFWDLTAYNKHGGVSLHSTQKDDIVLPTGERCGYTRVVEMDGKSPLPAAAQEQQHWYDQLMSQCQAELPEPHPDTLFITHFRKRGDTHELKTPIPFEDLPKLFDLKLLGTETVRGRTAYAVQATPRPGIKPADTWERDELGDEVELWIDVAEQVPVRLHFNVRLSGSFLKQGSSFEMEWEKIRNGEWWFLTHTALHIFQSGRLLGDVEETFSGFKAFRVQTQVLADSAHSAFPDSRPHEAEAATQEQIAAEAAVRSLVQQAFEAYARGDLAQLFSLFSPSAPELLIAKIEVENSTIYPGKTRLSALGVEDVRILGDTASARLSFEISSQSPDAGSGKRFYSFQLVREAGAWKLWSAANDEQELAADLVAAESEEERDRILAEQAPMVTEELTDQLVGHGNGLIGVGDYAHAMTSFQLAYKIAQRLDDKSTLWKALFGLGHGTLVHGDPALAADYFQKSLAAVEKLQNPSYLAFCLYQIGKSYAERGDYRQAMQYYQKSATESSGPDGKEQLASTLQSIGDLYLEQDNQAQALEQYHESLKLFTAIEASVDVKLKSTAALGKIGEVFTRQGNYGQALEYYQKNLKLFQELDHTQGVAFVLKDMGDNYFLQGRPAQALEHYQKALDLFEEMEHRPGIAATLNRMGSVYYQLGDYAKAIDLCRRAADIARELGSPPEISSVLSTLGVAYFATKQNDQARQALREAIENIETLRAHVAGTERDRELFFEGKLTPYHAMVQLLIEQHDFSQALEYAERAKGRELVDLLRNGKQDVTKAMTREERLQEQSLNQTMNALNSQLATLSRERRPSRVLFQNIENQLKHARLEYEALETQVYSAHPSLKVERGQAEPPSLQELGALIPDAQTVLLEYVVTREKTYLFALTRGRNPGTTALSEVELHVYPIVVKAQDLADRVAGFRTRLASNALDFRELALLLYDQLIAPAHQDLLGKTTLCIVPSGPLWELPFQALISRKGRYMLRDYALFYASSLSVLKEMRNRKVAASPRSEREAHAAVETPLLSSSSPALLGVGNPALVSGGQYSPLPEQERLLRTLVQIYGPQNSKILVGRAAQKETIKAEAGKYRVLHFATHGMLDNDNPLYSRLLLAGGSDGEQSSLEAREIMQMDLHADLAVLSACETARGRVQEGEGLLGMSWAMFVAGTPTTVASQWKIDSAATARLMTYFHRMLKSQLFPPEPPATSALALRHPLATYRMLWSRPWEELSINKAKALQQAELKLMADPAYRHPFYWAGFVVVGDGLGNSQLASSDEF
jgi:CHAT domain-containing protein/predicted negative regulator of RcsB-dependent stress response